MKYEAPITSPGIVQTAREKRGPLSALCKKTLRFCILECGIYADAWNFDARLIAFRLLVLGDWIIRGQILFIPRIGDLSGCSMRIMYV